MAVSRPIAEAIVNSTLSFVSGRAEYLPIDLLGQRRRECQFPGCDSMTHGNGLALAFVQLGRRV
jgi:hypothetical protein